LDGIRFGRICFWILFFWCSFGLRHNNFSIALCNGRYLFLSYQGETSRRIIGNWQLCVLLHWGAQVLLRLFISSSPMHHWMALEVVVFAFNICSFDVLLGSGAIIFQ
jgi:hypothetical protein